ncbi:substrate-binding domain-containing protein [Pseudonocardia spinosispora]|uniref:substrate-binding domain-containing protein n=1 Tax=Pseudonocardia spinosispora TaxID=103441 RepID=UPI0003FFF608|nr:substrate-binding domain-containing protein [Pseudonocardia spinosispora]
MDGANRVRAGVTGVLAALTVAGLAACAGGEPAGNAVSTGHPRIAVVIKGVDNQFFQAMRDGIEDSGAASGTSVTVQAATAITDTTGQADKLSGLAGQDYGCYLVNPISGTNLVQGIAQLAASGRAIVNIDSPVDPIAARAVGARIATYIGTDNVAAGAMAARRLAALLPPSGGEVAVVGGIAGDVTSGNRIQGFVGALGPGIRVVQTAAADWDRQQALTKATDILAASPRVAGFFAANDDMGLGVARAVANAGRVGQVQVVSVDGNPDALAAVRSGELAATVAQYPYAIGEMGVDACRAAASGASLPTKVDAPVALITTDDVDRAIAAAPKPFTEYTNPFPALIKK